MWQWLASVTTLSMECVNYVNDIEIPQNLRPTYKGDISNIADYGTVLSKSLFC